MLGLFTFFHKNETHFTILDPVIVFEQKSSGHTDASFAINGQASEACNGRPETGEKTTLRLFVLAIYQKSKHTAGILCDFIFLFIHTTF